MAAVQAILQRRARKLAKLTDEFFGIKIKKIGRKNPYEITRKKHCFYRIGLENGIPGQYLIKFTGDKCRITPYLARQKYIQRAKTDWEMRNNWKDFREFIKKYEETA